MNGMELTCFEIISAVGTARSLYIEAIQEAKRGKYTKAEALMLEGSEAFTQGHHAHAKLIQQEANGNVVEMTLLLAHAEDQLMSAEAFKILAREFIDIYNTIQIM